MNRVALIGAGNMGSAMLKGWLDSGTLEPGEIVLTDKEMKKASSLAKTHGIEVVGGNAAAAGDREIVVLAVKPQDCQVVLEEISDELDGGSAVVSIIAGLSLASMREKLGESPSLIRAMPNLGAHFQAAVSGYALDPGRGGFDSDMPVRLLEAFGEAVEVDEGHLDAVTAVSGSGPAYFFLMVEALEDAAVEEGLPPEVARVLARETLWSAARVLKEGGREAAELRQAVSSPGGTTLAALGVLDEAGFKEIMSRAVTAARKRAGELTR